MADCRVSARWMASVAAPPPTFGWDVCGVRLPLSGAPCRVFATTDTTKTEAERARGWASPSECSRGRGAKGVTRQKTRAIEVVSDPRDDGKYAASLALFRARANR